MPEEAPVMRMVLPRRRLDIWRTAMVRVEGGLRWEGRWWWSGRGRGLEDAEGKEL